MRQKTSEPALPKARRLTDSMRTGNYTARLGFAIPNPAAAIPALFDVAQFCRHNSSQTPCASAQAKQPQCKNSTAIVPSRPCPAQQNDGAQWMLNSANRHRRKPRTRLRDVAITNTLPWRRARPATTLSYGCSGSTFRYHRSERLACQTRAFVRSSRNEHSTLASVTTRAWTAVSRAS